MKALMTKLLECLPQQDMVLVTIVDSSGSTPRGVGAQMLAGRAGRLAGTVGGGAVEGKALQRALLQLEAGASCRMHYGMDGTAGRETDMICGGSVELLYSYVGRNDAAWERAAREVLRRLDAHLPGALVLAEDAPPQCCGEELTMPAGGMQDGRFALPLAPSQRVILFGGGHVAQALAPVLASVGFAVTVFENRPVFADAAHFPHAERVILGDYEAVADFVELREDDFYIIMTHGHHYDCVLQEQLLRRGFAYIGVMGSRRKIAAVNEKLREAGIDEAALARVHTPIGLPIHAQTPEEIAVSVAAECIAVRASLRSDGAGTCPSCQ